ncbi:P-loop containing nucleoside triphosphate hydrolase protein [Lindgomyces ingoldianus]|uniref:P-loop containing nucleoside triphosphate hydrolase protein n=1 Tax=Lindgomyces ingoldianus TaxID=673940 RepID=A0ACB6QFN1_9PLEO|nr:P-loop containing nucleoside triphosphate hydrolase protein [Lindgomyces ingoldianus]KAF2465707.1 P-loop containing nucleoside triphosphate hydrolase protein [Lindgomyces ingoldianus]
MPAIEKEVIIFGEGGVGKTCFTDMFMRERHFAFYDPTVTTPERKRVVIDGLAWSLRLVDLRASLFQESDLPGETGFAPRYFVKMLRDADGIIFLYDITSKASYEHIVNEGYLDACRWRRMYRENTTTLRSYPAGMQRFGCILVGNKLDLGQEKREVDRDVAQEWAESMGMQFFELSAFSNESIKEAMTALVKSMIKAEERDNEDLSEGENLKKSVVAKAKKLASGVPFRGTQRKMISL